MKKFTVILVTLALVLFLGCEKRSPLYTQAILPLVEGPSSISIERTLDTNSDPNKEKVTEYSFEVELTDKKKDVIWKIKDIQFEKIFGDYYLVAKELNPRTGVKDNLKLGDIVDSTIYNATEETFCTQEELSAQADLVKKSKSVSIYLKKRSDVQPWDNGDNDKTDGDGDADATTSLSYISENGVIEAETRLVVTLETVNGDTKDIYVPVSFKITGDSDLLKKPTAVD